MPPVAWQVTGNHWLAVPCIHPTDGSIHAIGVVHRGLRSAIELAGSADFVGGAGAPLARPVVRVDGVVQSFVAEGSAGIVWERASAWMPTFTTAVAGGALVVRGTVFAPFGPEADYPGVIYVVSVENRGEDARVSIGLEGTVGHYRQRVRTARAFTDGVVARQAGGGGPDIAVVTGSTVPGILALAIGADDRAPVAIKGDAGSVTTFVWGGGVGRVRS